jgi:hypothetical protein
VVRDRDQWREGSNESLGSMKGEEFSDKLSDY